MPHKPPAKTAPSDHVGMGSAVVLHISEVDFALTEGQSPDLALNPAEVN